MRLAMHICCAPCACYPVRALREKGIEPVLYFFNPNIHPYLEWERRMQTAKDFAEKVQVKLFADENYRLREFLKKALPAESYFNGRCQMCYSWRLEETARFAAEQGFDAFASTLFYSIYQQHNLMRQEAERCAKKYGIDFYYEDFRIGWQEGIDISHELELYRQPYCGCVFSEEERYTKAISNREKRRRVKEKLAMEKAFVTQKSY